ncbi:transcriptional regulator with PAS, ATPase and Fis domain [Evansella vedderi]|uniref:Transcriptional regulator with PAS, ATPase and Fis domain n=1 Tax=Evansella vedderi TaxID=38282 RepID=A0ABT9ZPT9_9BACI|nr:sigma-54-dependent Fis family transcriptional regulator [Evansella vedderi]MDQ0253259.1 transcriptional regulator with PAS, ATPase and Fis domain [Evansella vedderi]
MAGNLKDSILTMDEAVLPGYQVKDWMNTPFFLMIENQTMKHILELMTYGKVQDLVVISRDHKVVGLLSQERVNQLLLSGVSLEHEIQEEWIEVTEIAFVDDSIFEVSYDYKTIPVVNNDQQLVGVVHGRDIVDAYSSYMTTFKHNAEVLDVILETAYEGIVVVDKNGLIKQMNKAYRSFLGIQTDEEVFGKPVTSVIENTKLHTTVKTGIPEKGEVQVIQGQKMIVHRIPIWRDKEVVGAIGMLIFEGVTELYRILENASKVQSRNEVQRTDRLDHHDVQASTGYTFEKMVGESHALNNSKSIARKASRTKATVLITGESGTGKELFAQSIHNLSARCNGPFISLNCAAIPENLLEAELFGYEDGAFTGAKKGGNPGKFELANQGTIFLDEIGDMPLAMQAKILRVLEEEEIVPVGGNHTKSLDVRVIAATNCHLIDRVKSGDFREDLYFRLNVILIDLPPLKRRREDIPLLLDFYLKELANKFYLAPKVIDKGAVKALMNYHWPGNIRELVNVVEQLLTLVDGDTILYEHLPLNIKQAAYDRTVEQEDSTSLIKERGNQEKMMIRRVLAEMNGNKTKAAKRLGIHRTTLYQKIRKYQL